MATTQTTTLTFRIKSGLKEVLRTAAEHEPRSIANTTAMDGGSADNAGAVVSTVEMLIRDYCGRKIVLRFPSGVPFLMTARNQPKAIK